MDHGVPYGKQTIVINSCSDGDDDDSKGEGCGNVFMV